MTDLRVSRGWVYDREMPQPRKPTEREIEVLLLLTEGLTMVEVAQRLSLARTTVRTHRENLQTRLCARNGLHAVAIAFRKGWIT